MAKKKPEIKKTNSPKHGDWFSAYFDDVAVSGRLSINDTNYFLAQDFNNATSRLRDKEIEHFGFKFITEINEIESNPVSHGLYDIEKLEFHATKSQALRRIKSLEN